MGVEVPSSCFSVKQRLFLASLFSHQKSTSTRKISNKNSTYINLREKRKDKKDLVNCLIHLQTADHHFNDVVDRVGVVDLFAVSILLMLLIPE